MPESCAFIRRLLLLVFYSHMSAAATSALNLEGVGQEERTMSQTKPSGVTLAGPRTQFQTYVRRRQREAVLGGLRSYLVRRSLSGGLYPERTNNNYQSDDYEQGMYEEESKTTEEDDGDELQQQRNGGSPWKDCRRRLNEQIEACLSGFEDALRDANYKPKKQSNDPPVRDEELCREYEQTMQCLHLAFAACRPDHLHLHLMAYRLGYLRASMEQTCDELEEEEETDDKEHDEKEKLQTDGENFSKLAIATVVSVIPDQPQNSLRSSGTTPSMSAILLLSQQTLNGTFLTLAASERPLVGQVPEEHSTRKTKADDLGAETGGAEKRQSESGRRPANTRHGDYNSSFPARRVTLLSPERNGSTVTSKSDHDSLLHTTSTSLVYRSSEYSVPLEPSVEGQNDRRLEGVSNGILDATANDTQRRCGTSEGEACLNTNSVGSFVHLDVLKSRLLNMSTVVILLSARLCL